MDDAELNLGFREYCRYRIREAFETVDTSDQDVLHPPLLSRVLMPLAYMAVTFSSRSLVRIS